MEKIAIITDSTADISADLIQSLDLHVLPLQIVLDHKTYRDQIEITSDEVYQQMDREIPKTSLPLTNDVIKLLDELKEKDYTHIIGVFISSGLSGTYNMIRNIIQDYQDSFVYRIIDSKSISYGFGFAVLEAGRMLQEKHSFDQIVENIQFRLDQTRSIFVIPTLTYLKKGGRIGHVEGTLGELLNLKPLVGVDQKNDGKYITLKKVRGFQKAKNALFAMAKDLVSQAKEFKAVVMYGTDKNSAISIVDKLRSLPNCVAVTLENISPVIGIHSGPGVIGIGLTTDEMIKDLAKG